MKRAFIGVDIGGTKIAAHVSDGSANSIHTLKHATPVGADAILKTVITICRELQQHADVKAIGIGTAGQVNPHTGEVLDANENIPGWRGVSIAEHIKAALDLPVFVENDVRVMALAECNLGAGKGFQHVLCITVGTGIGGAIILNGKLWHGAHFSAGEIGYLYAEEGLTIEESYAGPAIERQQMSGNTPDVVQRAAYNLGIRLAPVVAFLDPEAVIIGGGVPEIGDLWWQPFTESIKSYRLKSVRSTPILRAELGNRAGMIGAAILAKQKVENV